MKYKEGDKILPQPLKQFLETRRVTKPVLTNGSKK